MNSISMKDREILRRLAYKQMEYAGSKKNLDNIMEWKRHRRFEKGRPIAVLEIGGFANEVLAPRSHCVDTQAQAMEERILRLFLNRELFDDDKIVPAYFPIHHQTSFKLFDIDVIKEYADSSAGHHFVPIIKDLEDDFGLIKKSTYTYNKKLTEDMFELADSIFGDILPIKMEMPGLYAVPTQDLVHIMEMETLLFSFYDYPELVAEVMNRIADDYIEYFKWIERNGLLLPTTETQAVGQGTHAYTDELPSDNVGCTEQVWGFMDSQETVGISPDMYGEFIFPCYEKISKIMGLLSYGCCEPVDGIWEDYLSKLDNLRNVSISAWCDEEKMGQFLRGRSVVYHRKPSANFLCTTRQLDEDAFRAHIRKTLSAAQGCQLEITQRDILTIHHDETKARRYVEIIKDECEKNWVV